MSFIVFTIFRLQMCQCIEKVVQLAIATFSKKTPQETAKKNLDLLIAQTNKLTNVDVGLEHCSVFDSSPPRDRAVTPAPVTYIPVVENQHISMGIFVIREGQNIPLHDHPNMHGVIKCIAGKLNVTSFSKLVRIDLSDCCLVLLIILPPQDRMVATPERFRRSPNLLEKIKYGQLFPAEQSNTVTIDPDSVCCLLSPTNSNVHK